MTTTKKVDLANLASEFQTWFGLRQKEFMDAAARGIAQGIPLLVAATPVDTGLLAQSWDMTIDETEIILGNYAPYAPMMELGTRPFTPPMGPLLAWAKRVLKDGSQPPDYSPAVWAVAKHAQSKIAIEGIKPRHVMENTLPQIVELIKKEFEKLG